MIARAIAANVAFSFVAADTVYGVGSIEMALRRAGKGYPKNGSYAFTFCVFCRLFKG
jgi:SRSO17 transposase